MPLDLVPSDPCPECCEADGNVLCDLAYCTHWCHKPSAAGTDECPGGCTGDWQHHAAFCNEAGRDGQ